MEFQAVLQAVRALPVDDQVRLVDQLHDDWQAHESDHGLTPAQIAEIERRIAAYDADPNTGIPWEEFEAHMDKRMKELDEARQVGLITENEHRTKRKGILARL